MPMELSVFPSPCPPILHALDVSPSDIACLFLINQITASKANVCTVRCFNKAATGPFGGCFAVQQTDIKGGVNQAATIPTAQTLAGITAQIAANQKDLPAALKANVEAPTVNDQGVDAVDELLKIDSVASATAGAAGATAASTTSAAAKKGKATGAAKANGNNNGNGKGNAGAANANNGKNQRRGARVFFS